MYVSVTQFRKQMFELVGHVMAGEPLLLRYKGEVLRLTREDQRPRQEQGSRLGRIQAIDLIADRAGDDEWKEQMFREMEEDWKSL